MVQLQVVDSSTILRKLEWWWYPSRNVWGLYSGTHEELMSIPHWWVIKDYVKQFFQVRYEQPESNRPLTVSSTFVHVYIGVAVTPSPTDAQFFTQGDNQPGNAISCKVLTFHLVQAPQIAPAANEKCASPGKTMMLTRSKSENSRKLNLL